jgi:hypothetical protein
MLNVIILSVISPFLQQKNVFKIENGDSKNDAKNDKDCWSFKGTHNTLHNDVKYNDAQHNDIQHNKHTT